MGTGVGQEVTSGKLYTQEEMNREITNARDAGFNAGYVNGARESNQPSAFANQAQNTSKGLLSKLGVSKTVAAVFIGASVAILAATVFSGGTALVLAAAAGLAYYHLTDLSESSPPPIYHTRHFPPNLETPRVNGTNLHTTHNPDANGTGTPRGLGNRNGNGTPSSGEDVGRRGTEQASSATPKNSGPKNGLNNEQLPSNPFDVYLESNQETQQPHKSEKKEKPEDSSRNVVSGNNHHQGDQQGIDLLESKATEVFSVIRAPSNLDNTLGVSAKHESDDSDAKSISSEVGGRAGHHLADFPTGGKGGNQINGKESVEGETKDGKESVLDVLKNATEHLLATQGSNSISKAHPINCPPAKIELH